MLIDLLVKNLWFVLIIMSLLYISDYFLTLKSSYLYHQGANKHISYEGGIELNPRFRPNINKLVKINWKFIGYLILIDILLMCFWFWSRILNNYDSVEILLGGFILIEFFVHTKHVRNIFLFQWAKQDKGIKGKIEYSREIMHKLSTIDALVFGIFYFILFLLFNRSFFLAGLLCCLAFSIAQNKWLNRVKQQIVKETNEK